MKITNQETAEYLKELIDAMQGQIESMECEYLGQCVRTIEGYFADKVSITEVRKIRINFGRILTPSCSQRWTISTGGFGLDGVSFKTLGVNVVRTIGTNDKIWQERFEMSKGDKRLTILIGSDLACMNTEILVYEN